MNSRRQVNIVYRVFRSGIWGLLSLCAVNLCAAFTGVSLGFGWLTGGAAALLGVPGVIGLLTLNALFGMV